jgi:hypothetical protein
MEAAFVLGYAFNLATQAITIIGHGLLSAPSTIARQVSHIVSQCTFRRTGRTLAAVHR